VIFLPSAQRVNSATTISLAQKVVLYASKTTLNTNRTFFLLGVLAKIESGDISGDDLVRSILSISQVAEEAMGGTSGALYS